MTELMQASHQWMKRPPEERFTDLRTMLKACENFRRGAVTRVVPNRAVKAAPVEDDSMALALVLNGMPVVPSHWAFGQICGLIGAPAGYLRRLPVPMIADCLNFGLHIERRVEEIGTMTNTPDEGPPVMVCATGPNYGRVWNDEVLKVVIEQFGNGQDGRFTVPGEFGRKVNVDENNTTLYRSDRDMFLFLADETNRVEIPDRRDGKPGFLARGFFIQNSEVGATTLAIKTFLFDYACTNRIVWGAADVSDIVVRHTSGAPHRWLEEVAPALKVYADGTTHRIVDAVKAAQSRTLKGEDRVLEFLASRFNSRTTAKAIMLTHEAEEGRPIETLWDAVTGITAYAKGVTYTADRVDIETAGGKVLALAQ